jgi:hypothetical protein
MFIVGGEMEMAIIKGLAWTFNTVANEYNKWNPKLEQGWRLNQY